MKFNIGDKVTKKNVKYVIKYLFQTDNITHQAIIIHQLNNLVATVMAASTTTLRYPGSCA